MTFNDPQFFWWMIPVVVLVIVLACRAGRKRKEQLKLLLGGAAEDPDAVLLSKGTRKFRLFLLLVVFLFLAAAAARPYWTSRMVPYSQPGRDIMVLFDVSKSMLATDIAPSRLAHAKFILRELVKGDPQDRFGLVAFAGTAYTVCPLTSDPVAFEQYIDELSPDLVPVGGTNLEQALLAATRAFKAAGGSNRAIVLFTDGDELEGDSARILAELKQRNTPLFIVGLGDPQAGAPVPDGNGGFRRDDSGKLIVTKLAESKLIRSAEATGGMYVRSTVTDTGLAALERRIRALSTAEQSSGVRTIPVEKFPLALIAAAAVLLLYLVVSERPMARHMVIFLLPVLFVCGAAENPAAGQQAVPAVRQAEKLPDSPEELYNLARERQLKGSEDAVRLYEEVLKRSEHRPGLQARSLFNIGTGVHRGGREVVTGARSQLQAQQLDPALKKLEEAKKRLDEAEELYARALSIGEAREFHAEAAGNLQQLHADRKKIEELKKQIEDLKKQQEKARQDAKNAKDKNQQKNQQKQQPQKQNDQQKQKDQQNQPQKQNDRQKQQNQKDQQKQQQKNQKQDQRKQNEQDRKDQQGQQDRQQQQQQKQQQDRQSVDQAIDQARQSSQDLRKKADELKQDRLSEQARKAREELDKARQETDKEKKQKHLDEAYKALGGENADKKEQKKDGSPQKKDKDGKDKNEKGKMPEKLPAQPRAGEKEKQEKPDGKTAEQLLKMLNDEEKQRREQLMNMRRMRRAPVQKDW